MRLDVFLHRVCVLKSRTLAKEACERGKVSLNGERAKASRSLTPGDRIRLDLGVRVLEVEVLGIPERRLSKKEAPQYYRMISEERPEL